MFLSEYFEKHMVKKSSFFFQLCTSNNAVLYHEMSTT